MDLIPPASPFHPIKQGFTQWVWYLCHCGIQGNLLWLKKLLRLNFNIHLFILMAMILTQPWFYGHDGLEGS